MGDTMGAPRWKQRALYDAMKDAAALTGAGMRLARLATVDVVADSKLGAVLEGRAIVELGALGRFLEEPFGHGAVRAGGPRQGPDEAARLIICCQRVITS